MIPCPAESRVVDCRALAAKHWLLAAVVALAPLLASGACDRGSAERGGCEARDGGVEPLAASLDSAQWAPAIHNPFALQFSELPHRCGGCISPGYLDADVAREVLECVFCDAGYNPQRRFAFDRDGVAFIADGYDSRERVGYFYGSYDNLDLDAFFAVNPPVGTVDTSLADLAGWAANDNDVAGVRKLRSIMQLSSPVERERRYADFVRHDRPSKLSLSEAEALSMRAEAGSEFVLVASHFDLRFVIPADKEAAEEDIDAAWLIPDPAKRDPMVDAIREGLEEQAARRFEQTVRDYLRWAWSKGLRQAQSARSRSGDGR